MEKIFEYIYDKNQHVFVIKDLQNEPLFAANDVGKILNLESRMRDLLRKIDNEDKIKYKNIDIETYNYTNDYQPNSLFLTLGGLFSLIFKSKKHVARQFKKWVLRILLPQLYHTANFDGSEKFKAMKETIDNLLEELHRYRLKNKKAIKPGFFYIGQRIIITNGKKIKAVKIGITTNLKRRLKQHLKVWPTFKLISYFRLNGGLSMRSLESAVKPILGFKAKVAESTTETFYDIKFSDVQELVLSILSHMNPSSGTCVKCDKTLDPEFEVVCFDCYPVKAKNVTGGNCNTKENNNSKKFVRILKIRNNKKSKYDFLLYFLSI